VKTVCSSFFANLKDNLCSWNSGLLAHIESCNHFGGLLVALLLHNGDQVTLFSGPLVKIPGTVVQGKQVLLVDVVGVNLDQCTVVVFEVGVLHVNKCNQASSAAALLTAAQCGNFLALIHPARQGILLAVQAVFWATVVSRMEVPITPDLS
jgi:hypothetical protein